MDSGALSEPRGRFPSLGVLQRSSKETVSALIAESRPEPEEAREDDVDPGTVWRAGFGWGARSADLECESASSCRGMPFDIAERSMFWKAAFICSAADWDALEWGDDAPVMRLMMWDRAACCSWFRALAGGASLGEDDGAVDRPGEVDGALRELREGDVSAAPVWTVCIAPWRTESKD